MLRLSKYSRRSIKVISKTYGRYSFTTLKDFDGREKTEETRYIRELERLEKAMKPLTGAHAELEALLGKQLFVQCE